MFLKYVIYMWDSIHYTCQSEGGFGVMKYDMLMTDSVELESTRSHLSTSLSRQPCFPLL